MMNRISFVTRRDIFDVLKYGLEDAITNNKIYYFGRLSEIDFLSRIYDLKSLPSYDSRYNSAEGDIYQHTINNDDWDYCWVFSDNRFKLNQGNEDVILLDFLCEVFHPVVRNENQPWREILDAINILLNADGYQLTEKSNISGRSVYGWVDLLYTYVDTPYESPSAKYELKLIGEGSYANVYKYKDLFYNRFFALKRAKKDLDIKELDRFRREFDEMNQLNSPYIVEVFCYNEEKHEYVMEWMDYTLDDYIKKHNNIIPFEKRKAIAAQVIKSMIYIHSKNRLHRDLSPKNILIKEYEDIIVVKLSDFGLVKIPESSMTSINTEFKGYFNDPELRLEGFVNYSILHETYALTRLIYFIMTGKTNTEKITNDSLRDFVSRGITTNKLIRYQNIDELRNAFNLVTEFETRSITTVSS